MKKRTLALLMFLIAGAASLAAQNVAYTMYFEQPEENPCVNETFCIDVTVENFSNIAETDFNMLWDSTVLEFVEVTALNLDGLTQDNFTLTNAGTLNMAWQVEDCETISQGEGVTLDDCGNTCRPTIFRLCFRTLQAYGDATAVTVGPNRYTTKDNSNCVNLQTFVEPAYISTCVRPFIVNIADGQGNEEDLVCLDFTVSGLDSLSSFQFPVVWDSTLAKFASVVVPQNLPNLSLQSFGTPLNAGGVQEGSITVSWGAPPPQNTISVNDSTLIFQLCLRLEPGSCSRDILVSIADQQPGQPFFRPEATNEFMGGFNNIQVGQREGLIEVGPCNPQGVEVAADCGAPVDPNSSICVEVEAGGNFQDVTDLAFLMTWNPNILAYTGVQGFGLPGLNATGFNVANTNNGILGFEWDGPAQDRTAGDVLFEVCFDVIGVGGNSPFQFINNNEDVAQINNQPSIGINPSNCEVQVNQLPGVVIDMTGALQGQPGDTLCFDFAASNFVEVDRMTFSLVFEPSELEFILAGGIQNMILPGASAANFNLFGVGGGQILFEYDPDTPVTLPEGSNLFTLCFRIPDNEALAGVCNSLLIASDPLEAEVITASSNGENIGLTGINGDYCILSPDGFWLVGGNVSGDLRDTVCVPFKVGEFTDITSGDFCINWAPGSLNLVELNNSGVLPNLTVDPAGQPVGSACFSFGDAAGTTLADSTTVFEMCFELLGPADTCYQVSVSDAPAPMVETLNGTGSLLDESAIVCIDNRLFIDSVLVTPESCPGVEDGEIRLVVSGGNQPYAFSWGTTPPQFGPVARFLPAGEVIVTVIDVTGLIITDTITVPVGGSDLFVDAGPDRIANCGDCDNANFLNPQATSTMDNPNVSYQWTASQGGQICGASNGRIIFARGPGQFVIEVRDDSSGCFVRDTLQLLAPELPVVAFEQAEPPVITCDQPAVGLSVEEQAGVDYSWTGPNGFLADTRAVMAADSGTYVVTVSFIDSGCSVTDSITVDIDTQVPFILASPGSDSVFVGCNNEATLNGFISEEILNFSARWLDAGGNEVSGNQTYATDQPGVYFFEVVNNDNGCTALDSTVVSLEASLPAVSIEEGAVIDCRNVPVDLNVSVTNASPGNVVPVWSSADGGQLEPGTEGLLEPTVIVPGTFGLTITDNATGCTASASVTVAYDTIPPVAVAEVQGLISCDSETATLDGSGSDTGENVIYAWFSADFNQDVGTNIQEPVGAAGTYILTVEDTLRGCINTDTVMVALDTLPPAVTVTPAQTLTCNRDTVALAVNIGLPQGAYSAVWDGPIAETEGDTVARFDTEGLYTLTVTNLETGCEAIIEREIVDVRNFPEIQLAQDSLYIDCNTPAVFADATGSSMTDTNFTIVYTWTGPAGAAQGPFNQPTLEIVDGGTFVLSLRDVVSDCITTDTVFVASDTEGPEVMTNTSFSISCTNNMGLLDGTGSEVNDDYIYVWQRIQDGVVVDTVSIGGPEVITTPIANPGIYRLRVTNPATGCFTNGVPFQVTADGEVPQIVIGAPTEIGIYDYDCNAPDTVNVALSLANEELLNLDNLVYAWTGDVITTPGNPFTVGVTAPGIYEFMVTDTATGCVGVNELVVNDIRVFPEIEFAADMLSITCDDETVLLDAAGSDFAQDTTLYTWMDAAGNALGNEATLEAAAPGLYIFMIENAITGCTSMDTVMVDENTTPPAVLTEMPEDFTCVAESVLLSAGPTGDAADFDAVWEAIDGAVVTPNAGTLTASVAGPGTYQLTLTSLANGCDSVVVFEVAADTLAPQGEIAMPGFLGCAGQTVTLDATSFGNNGEFDISWSSMDGNVSPATGSFLVDVDAPGTYNLTVTNPENGCEAMAATTVSLDPEAPMAVSSTMDNVLGCGETLTLDGAGSSEGAVYDYEWVAVDAGAMPPVPVTALTATVDAVGDYIFIVTNTATGCADTSEVVSIVLDNSLPDAAAQVDSITCDGRAFVSANLPEGATGLWTVGGQAVVVADTQAVTEVIDLGIASSELTWTLSFDGCPDYSSAAVTVTPELRPAVQNDLLDLEEGGNQGVLNVLSNDDLTGVPDYNLAFITNPALGEVDTLGGGEVAYTLTTTLFASAEDEFRYELCNANCPTLCDTGIVQVMIQRDSVEIETPNGITPNGDGLNDNLVFDQLLIDPGKYPNNELIIFNRWGDIVFQAQPYGNNWSGQNSEGKDLPDGTYYYILRLDIGGAEILRGDVTILR
ncbi:T9SS type B sorting domain-containing protein [Phaeodactylibacter luteus]|nr:gliding motility-associated C-terminal domain-containing protein [Phaeodactylibacter luteus]